MDRKFFRRVTDPNFYENQPSNFAAGKTANQTMVSPRNTLPTPDARFPGYSAPLEDGRIATDYRPHCNRNIPVGSQYGTKQWMIDNTVSIINLSRERQAIASGAIYADDSTVVPPPVGTVKCTPTDCAYAQGDSNGIGIEREDAAPEIFGTYTFVGRSQPPPSRTQLTHTFEAGRNTPRGRTFIPLGLAPAFAGTNYHMSK